MQCKNVIGTFYRCGNIAFSPDGWRLFSPIGNRVSVFDIKRYVARVLQVDARKNISLVAVSPNGCLLLAIDDGWWHQLDPTSWHSLKHGMCDFIQTVSLTCAVSSATARFTASASIGVFVTLNSVRTARTSPLRSIRTCTYTALRARAATSTIRLIGKMRYSALQMMPRVSTGAVTRRRSLPARAT